MKRFVTVLLVLALVLSGNAFAGGSKEAPKGQPAQAEVKPVKMIGATMLPQNHVYFKTIEKFAELLKQYYKGPLDIELHHSGDIGTEKDAIEYMLQGVAVDFAIISPAWIATWDKTAPIIDAPFIFKNVPHWEKCLDAKVFQSIEDNMIKKGVRFIGYGGGGTRNIISKKPLSSINDFPTFQMRVQGSPLHQKAFSATGIKATPMDYMEVYNAIKTGVLDGLENEPAGLEGMKFYEVAPYYVLTAHQITTRINGMSEKKFQSYPKELQEAVLKAGAEASAWHRKAEVGNDATILKNLQEKFGLKIIPFDNTEMRKKAMPAVVDYAKTIGAEEILKKIDSIN